VSRASESPKGEVTRPRSILAPWAAGLILDALDLATAGPIGFYGGFLVALVVGWFLASSLGFDRRRRAAISMLSAIYIATPFTELLPVATAVALLSRVAQKDESA
jgi:hypothetical protein